MAIIVGLLIVLGCVFGIFIASGGKIEIIIAAAPFEMVTILGASFGAMIIGNRGHILKGVGSGFGKAFKGPGYKKQDYIDLLCLMYRLIKLANRKV